jgi:DNA excision repair protein ERCC-2
MSKDSIVVFDEAHNIDNVCIESLSIDLTRPMLDSAARSCVKLENKIEEIKRTDATKLQDEYSKLVAGLQDANEGREEDDMLANPVLSEDMVQEAVPGNIRKAEHFVAFLKRFVEYMKVSRLSLYERRFQLTITVDPDASPACRRRNTTVFPTTFEGHHLHREEAAQVRVVAMHHQKSALILPSRFCAERLTSLVRTLELTQIDEYHALQKLAQFATLVATYEKGKRWVHYW